MNAHIFRSIIIALVLFLASSSQPLHSQSKRTKRTGRAKQTKPEWTYVCEDKGATSAYYIKVDRIGRTPQKTILVWEKQQFLAEADRGEYLILLYEHDCAEGKSRNLEFSRFSKNSEVLYHSGREKREELGMIKWIHVAPGTVREAILTAACDNASQGN